MIHWTEFNKKCVSHVPIQTLGMRASVKIIMVFIRNINEQRQAAWVRGYIEFGQIERGVFLAKKYEGLWRISRVRSI